MAENGKDADSLNKVGTTAFHGEYVSVPMPEHFVKSIAIVGATTIDFRLRSSIWHICK